MPRGSIHPGPGITWSQTNLCRAPPGLLLQLLQRPHQLSAQHRKGITSRHARVAKCHCCCGRPVRAPWKPSITSIVLVVAHSVPDSGFALLSFRNSIGVFTGRLAQHTLSCSSALSMFFTSTPRAPAAAGAPAGRAPKPSVISRSCTGPSSSSLLLSAPCPSSSPVALRFLLDTPTPAPRMLPAASLLLPLRGMPAPAEGGLTSCVCVSGPAGGVRLPAVRGPGAAGTAEKACELIALPGLQQQQHQQNSRGDCSLPHV